ncbi:MraY family glycosyltransferase [Catenibacterium mitsuokai]|uniref:MraY family glycosyltransferase n=1 Tax=Catenibacterium mitsuokai TaxID=100886 RepID=UPI003F8C52CC
MTLNNILAFCVTFIISVILTPFIGKITKEMGIIAHTNSRTVHHGIIPRTGGYAIYVAFLIGAMVFLKTDNQINSILIGGLIVFLFGLYDDIHDLPPKMKVLGQVAAALIVIFYGGISLKGFTIPYIPTILSYSIALIVTLGWIVGITNAVNLIDGLDGLCGGISMIVLITTGLISIHYGRTDITSLTLLLAGSIGGFLVFNFHPAKIFMGDCGALFIGFMLSVISLLGFGFKSSTFFTLGAPIVVLAVPIMDTLIAIIRRKVHHQRFDEADKGHLHHKLMFSLELGQTKSVLILYIATALFSICSFIHIYSVTASILLFALLLLVFEIFVEYTNMISRKYKPILTILNIFLKRDDLPKIKESKTYLMIAKRHHVKYILIGFLCAVIAVSGVLVYHNHNDKKPVVNTPVITYAMPNHPTSLMKSVHEDINASHTKRNTCQNVSALFAIDFFTISNKKKDEIGGAQYFYSDRLDNFEEFAKSSYYANVNDMIENNTNLDEVTTYEVNYTRASDVTLSGLEDYEYTDVGLEITFNKKNFYYNYQTINVKVTLIEKNNRFSVVSLDFNNGVSE